MRPSINKNNIPALDGIRGLAVLLVLLFHLSFHANLGGFESSYFQKLFGCGWAGVDLFFVLSGFLITGILVESTNEKFYFLRFYWRRTLRVFPLYFGTLLTSLFVFPWIHYPSHLFTGSEAAVPYFFSYVYNLYFVFHTDSPLAYLGPAWSLAIEEQFYLIWPMVAIGIFLLNPILGSL